MRFESATPAQTSEIPMDYKEPPTYGITERHFRSAGINTTPLLRATEEPNQYIHRCPFIHCPHDNTYEYQPCGFKIPLLTIQQGYWHPKIKRNDLRQGHYISRGTIDLKVTTEDRNKAITYMLSRMGLHKSLDPKLYSRLLASVSTLERQVFKASESKEKYIENLAKKLFLIFKELERRQIQNDEQQPSVTS